MSKTRLETFSDGVLAILITIMVLELRTPEGSKFADLRDLVPVLLAYLLSFVMLGIYWNNHHHLYAVVERIDGRVLWANMHLLFWLSLLPFATSWMGEHPTEPAPVACYGIVFLGAGAAYYVLAHALIAIHDDESSLTRALGNDAKGKISVVGYAAGVAIAFVSTWVAITVFVAIALMWLVPDRRITRAMNAD